MKKLLSIFLFLVGGHSLLGQSMTFSTTTSGNTSSTTYSYLPNVITATGLGNLDGINLAVTSLTLNLSGTSLFGLSFTKADIYLVAPDGTAVYIMFNDVSLSNVDFNFTNNATRYIHYLPFTSSGSIKNPYLPYGDLNSLNLGQSANGVWKLYARSNGLTLKINSWSITFGSSGPLHPGAQNVTCPFAIPLVNKTLTGNSNTGTNQYNGIILNATNPQPQVDQSFVENGGKDPMQTSVWYSFVPYCKDDIIEIVGSVGWIYSGIWKGSCGSLAPVKILPSFFNTTQTYSSLNFTPGQQYYLVMDSDQGDPFSYTINWTKGTCTQSNAITTLNPAKTSYCVNDTIYIRFTITGTFNTGNRFTVQISDAIGNFSSSQTIGYVDAVLDGSILASLPANLPNGSGYKVRVISNNPTATTLIESSSFQINSAPPTPTVLNGDFNICANQANVAYSTSTPTTGVHYRWKFPNGAQAINPSLDSISLSVNYGNTGGNISLQAVNACGVSSPLVQPVVMKPLVLPQVTIEGDTAICSSSTPLFKAIATNKGLNPSFTWWVNKNKQGTGFDSSFAPTSFQDHDTIRVQLLSNAKCASPALVTSAPRVIRITSSLVQSVQIVGNPQLCQGAIPDFRANASNAGNNPTYIWKVNGNPTNVQGPLFSNPTLIHHDTLSVEVTSNNPCASPNPAKSAPLLVSVEARSTPSVNITLLKQGLCQGDTFQFEVSATVTGTQPKFKWTVNSIATGDTTLRFESNKLKNGDTVGIQMTSNYYCITTPVVNNTLSVSIADTIHAVLSLIGNTQICPLQFSDFHAQLNSTLANPRFDWFVNGQMLPSHDPTVTALFQDKDTLWTILANAGTCIRPNKPISNKLVMSTKKMSEPITNISGPTEGCSGDLLSFSATITNGVAEPAFQWYINKSPQIGDTLSSFSTNKLQNGDSVFVQVKSSKNCSISNWTKSNVSIITLSDTLVPRVMIENEAVYCRNQNMIVRALPLNQGNKPSFKWSIDGTPFPQDSLQIKIPYGLSAGNHMVSLSMTSSERCARPNSASETSFFLVKDSSKANLVITGDTLLCQGNPATYSLASPLNLSITSYDWKINGISVGNNQPTLEYHQPQQNDSISLLVTTEEKCIAQNQLHSNSLKLHVTESLEPVVSIMSTQSEACIGEKLMFIASIKNPGANEQFEWFADGRQIAEGKRDSLPYRFTQPTTITLQYGADLTCGPYLNSVTAPGISLNAPPLLSTIAAPEDFCLQDRDVPFTVDLVSGAHYIWTFPKGASAREEGNKVFLNFTEKNIQDSLKVKAENSCGIGPELAILLRPKDCSGLFIPNALVSNDLSGNNVWQIKGLENYPEAEIQVFNRWGAKVYQSRGYSTPWDGTLKDKPLPAGTYYYVIHGTREKTITGDLTIVH